MARRSGQKGYVEKKGGWYHVRFRIDVAGQDKREYRSVPLCPVSGPDKLTKPERQRKAKEVIIEAGANSAELFEKIEAINSGKTFQKQAEWWLSYLQTRTRKPIAPATVVGYNSYLKNWVYPVLGLLPLASVNNLAVKGLVAAMVAKQVSAKMITNVVQVVKGVVASALNEDGEQFYPRQWNHDFIDLPIVTDQHRPTFTSETVTAIVAKATDRYRMLYALCAASGVRIGEALGLEIDKHILDDGRIIHLRQKAWNGQLHNFLKSGNARRDIDLHSSIAGMLTQFIGSKRSGLLFCTKSGRPLSPSKHPE